MTNKNTASQLQSDCIYHVYNRTNGNEKLFLSDDNYRFFLRQLKKYITPIAEIYAYCLIPNHFHFVIKIKEEKELNVFFKDKLSKGSKGKGDYQDFVDLTGFQNLSGLLSKQFSNLFNSYTKAYNKQQKRKGNLFQRAFKKKIITDKEYLQQVILYVHLNPVKHQLKVNFEDYTYSSYSSILSNKPTLLKRKDVFEFYDNLENFIDVHQQQKIKTDLINDIILLDD